MNSVLNPADFDHLPPEVRAALELDQPQTESVSKAVSRRNFMKASAGVGGGFVLAFSLGMNDADAQQAPGPGGPPPGAGGGPRAGGGGGGFGGGAPLNPSAYVRIMPDGKITLW